MNGFEDWMDGLTEGQIALQYNLSCLADGELDESAAARALVKIENDEECRTFFEDIKRCARMHRDVMEPSRISARIAMMAGELEEGQESQQLNRRLATIFYQLGKAYVLSAVDFDSFREHVFADAVPIAQTKTTGRGFVDGVLIGGRAGSGQQDWTEARHLFNGRLEKIEKPMEKGVRLLEQVLEIEGDHEEARIYLAFVHTYQGHSLKAERLYREVFDSALVLENRGHAAMQIGQLFSKEGDHRKAATYFRWVTLSGLAEREPRFWAAYFNLAIASLGMGRTQRGLLWFRDLLDRFPEHVSEAARLCMGSPTFRASIERDSDFTQAFEQCCPELLHAAANDGN
ncbi:MAG: tetratricopeptide (TPR) repeat protein [Planctomycetota bacterium]|jgi:tetratricopeptide (TPR) repeat protein